MGTYDLPPPRVNPHALPPPIMTSDLGSFAEHTMKVRIPRMIGETIELNAFPLDIEKALDDLRTEIIGERIRALREAAPDRILWDALSQPYIGATWLDVPWYWAEAYCYRRLLEATAYFQPGPWQGFDPFDARKRTELEPEAGPRSVDRSLRDLPTDPRRRFEAVLYGSLWGNRLDLSHTVAMAMGRSEGYEDERGNLLVDDSGALWDYLRAHPPRTLAILLDNAGTELLADLALADFLITERLAARIDLHVKAHPSFVSDAMLKDVDEAVRALGREGDEARALSYRIRLRLDQGELQVRTHWFYTTSLFYFQLPRDLHEALTAVDFVILKGDANYRRLLGDAHWPPVTPFDRATAYFPAPFVALRTLKSELIVGLGSGVAERTLEQDDQWLVNGRRGVIQARW